MSMQNNKFEELAKEVTDTLSKPYGYQILYFTQTKPETADSKYSDCHYFLVYKPTEYIKGAWRTEEDAVKGLNRILEDQKQIDENKTGTTLFCVVQDVAEEHYRTKETDLSMLMSHLSKSIYSGDFNMPGEKITSREYRMLRKSNEISLSVTVNVDSATLAVERYGENTGKSEYPLFDYLSKLNGEEIDINDTVETFDNLKLCKRDILELDGGIETQYETRNLDVFLTKIASKYSFDSVAVLVTNHIRMQMWEGRYDQEAKNWVQFHPQYRPQLIDPSKNSVQTMSQYKEYTLDNTHPSIINYACHWVIENEKNRWKLKPELDGKKSPVELLFEKLSVEQSEFKSWLLKQSPEEILNHSYEFTVRENILSYLTENELDLTERKVEALLDIPNVLSKTYNEFCNNERSDEYINSLNLEMSNTFSNVNATSRKKANELLRTHSDLSRDEVAIVLRGSDLFHYDNRYSRFAGGFAALYGQGVVNFDDKTADYILNTKFGELRIPFHEHALGSLYDKPKKEIQELFGYLISLTNKVNEMDSVKLGEPSYGGPEVIGYREIYDEFCDSNIRGNLHYLRGLESSLRSLAYGNKDGEYEVEYPDHMIDF